MRGRGIQGTAAVRARVPPRCCGGVGPKLNRNLLDAACNIGLDVIVRPLPPIRCSPIPNHDGTDCFRWDKTLWSQQAHFKYRWELFKSLRAAIDKNEGGLQKFAQGEGGVTAL